MGNVITAIFAGDTHARTESLWQFDYGMILRFDGITLPAVYEVHFATDNKGNSNTVLGGPGGVTIPDSLLLTGNTVYAWVYLHTGENDGETEYDVTIPVQKRAQPTNQAPTPVEQSIIEQAIALLNQAVEECEGCAEHYPKIVNDIWYVWDKDENDFVSTGIDANGLKGDTGPYFTPHVNANGIISWTNNGDLPNPPPADLASAVHLEDYALKSEVALKLDASQKGIANGVATLDSVGLVPKSQIPSYYDDVIEASSVSTFPRTGETGKIYVSTSNNMMYRWTGNAYAQLSALSLGETSSTAYRGDRGKTAYDHANARGVSTSAGFNKLGTNSEGHVTTVSPVVASDIRNTGVIDYEIVATASDWDAYKTSRFIAFSAVTTSVRDGYTEGFLECRFNSAGTYGTQTIIWRDGKRSTRTFWNMTFGSWNTEE